MKDCPSRQELIEICLDAVVDWSKWTDRDSYSAQKSIQSIYEGLTAGLEYDITRDENNAYYHIDFTQPINLTMLDQEGKYLEISSRDEYWEENGYESEMFDSYGIDFRTEYTSSYMPTREFLNYVDGQDWCNYNYNINQIFE